MTKDADSAVTALSTAIDKVTESILEKLESVEVRIVSLKQEITAKNGVLKDGLTDLVKCVDAASNEADALHKKIDAIGESIATLPKFPLRSLNGPGDKDALAQPQGSP